MAKKEQCVDCNKFGTEACPSKDAITFDNKDCEYYSSEKSVYSSSRLGNKKYPAPDSYHKYNSNDFEENKQEIKNWLLVFFIISGLAALSNLIIPLIDIYYATAFYKSEKIFWCTYALDGIALGFLIYTLFTFIHPKGHAIYNVQEYLSIIIISAVFKAFGAYFWEEAIGSIIFNIVWATIWLIYFWKSDYIATIIPKDTRKGNNLLYYINIMVFIPIIIAIQDIATISAYDLYYDTPSQQLTGKAYSNHLISVTAPEGFSVSEENDDGIESITLENENHYITILGDTEVDMALYSLDELWNNCMSEDFLSIEATISKWQPLRIKNKECYYRTSYISEYGDTVYGYFYVLYNDYLDKACIMVAYANYPDNSLYETVLNNITFKN